MIRLVAIHLKRPLQNTHWIKGFVQSALSWSHAAWLKVGSWHGDPIGTVATRLPFTVEFRLDHASALGQHASPGRQRQPGSCAAAIWRRVAKESFEILLRFILTVRAFTVASTVGNDQHPVPIYLPPGP